MNSRVKKVILGLLAAALLFSAGRVQRSINHDRDTLGLTRGEVLKNAPPMLAFTTVALGGFRGLISNYLWIRANDLQQDDKFFEATQLADWITELEPTYPQVWLFQAWNMAYNISVKFKDFPDRWRWLERGIELLREDGLRYNPNSIDIYRELAWFFQHKMGANLDDANIYYKSQWAGEMKNFFGPNGTNFSELLMPTTPEASNNVAIFREKFKMDPQFVKKVDETYGPFDWRLPEAHAIYWGAKGMDAAEKNPNKVKSDDLIKLRRIIYQSMLQAFHHGRILSDPFSKQYSLGPNLDLVDKVNQAYETNILEETDIGQREGIRRAHRNFLRDAVYYLYEDNRIAEANKWFKYLGEKYPDKPIIENQPDSLPKTLTLDEYAVAVTQIDIGETSQDRVTSALMGMLTRAYYNLACGEDDRYENLKRLVIKVYQRYVAKTASYNGNKRIPLPPFDTMNKTVIDGLLDPKNGIPYAARAVLRTQLGLPAETAASTLTSTNAASPTATNSIPAGATNAPAK